MAACGTVRFGSLERLVGERRNLAIWRIYY
jgi:hypothetical protein